MTSLIIFDSSSLISLSEKCFFELLKKIQSHSGARFLITPSVWRETVEKPQHIKRFELNAVRVQQAIEDNWLEVVQPTPQSQVLAKQIEEKSNHCFFVNENPLRILQAGEIESMAIYISLKADALVIDERTARMLIEEPLRLHNYISMKHDKKIQKNEANLKAIQEQFQKTVIVRSSDLLAWAYQHDLFKYELSQTKQALEAALYAVKFSGCAISSNEIKEFITKNG
ncbi:hypothetical protein KKE06_04165 [Candidatus Micrarchaeota archaeon]|nr:hypothetical protein [Candidatus Micrarchaeota archaeon]MBU1930284.1 hypothetical protein [Candidatus Micrarchaeota archaeon]